MKSLGSSSLNLACVALIAESEFKSCPKSLKKKMRIKSCFTDKIKSEASSENKKKKTLSNDMYTVILPLIGGLP